MTSRLETPSNPLTEMADMIFRYKIVLPPQVSMLIKTLIHALPLESVTQHPPGRNRGW